MNNASIFLALAASSLLSAGGQELDLMVSRMATKDVPSSNLTWFRPVQLTAYSLRYGYDLADFGRTCLQVQAAYQARVSADIPHENHRMYYFVMPTSHYTQDAWAIGLQAQWRHGVQFGLGPELRWDHLVNDGAPTTQVRPWLNARVGWNPAIAGLHWVAGLEAAWVLDREK